MCKCGWCSLVFLFPQTSSVAADAGSVFGGGSMVPPEMRFAAHPEEEETESKYHHHEHMNIMNTCAHVYIFAITCTLQLASQLN